MLGLVPVMMSTSKSTLPVRALLSVMERGIARALGHLWRMQTLGMGTGTLSSLRMGRWVR